MGVDARPTVEYVRLLHLAATTSEQQVERRRFKGTDQIRVEIHAKDTAANYLAVSQACHAANRGHCPKAPAGGPGCS